MPLGDLLIHTVDIEAQGQTVSAAGGVKPNYAPIATGVACRVEQLSGDAVIAYGALGYKVSDLVFFDSDPTVIVNDRLSYAGEYLYVRRINPVYAEDPSTPDHWEIMAERKPKGIVPANGT